MAALDFTFLDLTKPLRFLRGLEMCSAQKRLPNNELCIKNLANDEEALSVFAHQSTNFSPFSVLLSALLHRQGIAFLKGSVSLEFAVFNASCRISIQLCCLWLNHFMA